jgi:hypothetical protein
VNSTNKNAVSRLHPTVNATTGEVQYLIYVRGNSVNPLGVVAKLMEYGGMAGSYTTADLMTTSNLFYIDYNNNKIITFISESEILADAIKSSWEEVAITATTSTPDSWEGAVIDYPAAALYEDGNDTVTNEQVHIIGKLKVLRDIWRNGWTPYNSSTGKMNAFYFIGSSYGELQTSKGSIWERFLSFQDAETRDSFLETYKDDIETVKELL